MSDERKPSAGCDLKVRPAFLTDGAYRRLFPGLNAWQPEGSSDDERRNSILQLSQLYAAKDAKLNENAAIPAGYAFFGQFITHDLTFTAPISNGPPINQRTPRFDLDCLYGGGPAVHPHLYTQRDPRKFLIGRNEFGELDLPRNSDGTTDTGSTDTFNRHRTALIGDPRNDETIILSQLHLALLLHHNRLVDEHGVSFEVARKITRWSYQLAALDYLGLLCGDVLRDVLPRRDAAPSFQIFQLPDGSPVFIPLEFSLAGFRIGHSMIGENYPLNDSLRTGQDRARFRLFADGSADPVLRDRKARNTLEGQRELPKKWTIQWGLFVPDPNARNTGGLQPSQRIDRSLSDPLRTLPIPVSPGARDERERSLAYRTLLSGWQNALPSGKCVAQAFPPGLNVKVSPAEDLPLWLYILREAEEEHDGKRLGPVGARLVAEVCVRLLFQDRESVLHARAGDRDWDLWNQLNPDGADGFRFVDLLVGAGVPISWKQWKDQVPDAARTP
jgi:hypothetical protein